ncbi:MAG: hypothetical protein RLZZ326_2519, partial [Planctomycetota bacterium]
MPIRALSLLIRCSLLLVVCFGRLSAGLTAAEPNGSTPKVLPPPPAAFRGTINLRAKDSTPDFPQPVRAPQGAPNVL